MRRPVGNDQGEVLAVGVLDLRGHARGAVAQGGGDPAVDSLKFIHLETFVI